MDKELPEEPRPAAEKLWQPGVVFTERELALIANCNLYACNNPAGLPGHHLMVIIDKFDQLLGQMASYLLPEQVEACAEIFADDDKDDDPAAA